MNFTKMQGAGNDFIIINNMELKLPVEKLSNIANKLCKRKLSIGADGLMVVDFPDTEADFKMRFYNQDGSIGEMCGNGARCISRYAYLNKIAGKKMSFETGAGIVEAEILEKRLVKVQLNNPGIIKLNNSINIDDKCYECSYVELGRPGLPHAVVKYDLQNSKHSEVFEIGNKIRFYKEFLKGANVNFFEVLDEETALVKTYERGVEDITLACGTGSAATALVLILKGYLKKNKVKVINPGGQLYIEVEMNKNTSDLKDSKDLINAIEKLYLIGSTNIVAVGKIMDEDLII